MAYENSDDLEDLLSAPVARQTPHNGPRMATEADLAAFWGVSTRQVRKLLSDGVIQKSEGKLYDMQLATAAYIQHLITSAKIRGGADPDLKAEKLRLAREQADKLALQNALARGEYVAASEVKSTWAEILRDVRAAMLAIPGRVLSRLPHLTPHDVGTLDAEIRQALNNAATQSAEGESL